MRSQKQKEWFENNREYLAEYKRRSYLSGAESRKSAYKKYKESEKGKKNTQKHEWKSKKKYLESPVNKIKALLTGAKRRSEIIGGVFDVALYATFVDIANIPSTCVCCGAPFDFTFGGRRKTVHGRRFSPSLDRIDNTKGYTVDNVVVICTRCNLAKGASSLLDLERLVAYITVYGSDTAQQQRRAVAEKAVEEYARRAELAKKVHEKPFLVLTPEERRARREQVSAESRVKFAAMTIEERRTYFAAALRAGEALVTQRETEYRGDLGPLDWSTIDWSQPNLVISRREKVSKGRVQKMRKQLGHASVDGRKVKLK